MELPVSRAIRRRSPYRLRADKKSPRPFGGVNVLLFSDWWQLKPASGTALFSNPSEARPGTALKGLELLWLGMMWDAR